MGVINNENSIGLSDEELSSVSGGAGRNNMMQINCSRCKKNIWADLNKEVVVCSYCGTEHRLDG